MNLDIVYAAISKLSMPRSLAALGANCFQSKGFVNTSAVLSDESIFLMSRRPMMTFWRMKLTSIKKCLDFFTLAEISPES